MNLFKIETIKDQNGNEVSFCPSRGGIITSLQLKGQEVFYFNEDTFNNKVESVRGGIPILFPNAGELLENKIFPNLTRHGFARNMEWDFVKNENSFQEILVSNKITKDFYPYEFSLSISGNFIDDGSFVLSQEIKNNDEREMPVASGLHPYFYVPNSEKKNIIFNFAGGEKISSNFELWANGGTISIDNPKLKDESATLKLVIPSVGEIAIDPSPLYKKIWIWSLPEKDFICIEPMMRDEGGLLDNPEIVKPQESLKISLKISLI